MHLGLTKSRDDKLLQDLLDKKLRVIVVFEDDFLNHIARIAYKDIQQDNYTYRIGEYNIYKGEEWGFCNFCKRHDCYFIVPNETIEGGCSEIPNHLNELVDYARRQVEELLLVIKKYDDYSDEQIEELRTHLMAMFLEGAGWQKKQMLKEAVEGFVCINAKGYSYVRSYILDQDEIPYGDKVRIIIVKED